MHAEKGQSLTALIILMIASLALTLIVSVIAIITSTSNGTDWVLRVWNNRKKGKAPRRPDKPESPCQLD